MNACRSCGSTHMGPVPCGLTFAQRMRTTSVDTAALETRSLRNYYDSSAVEAQFGHDAKDRLLEETNGIGYTQPDNNGEWWHRNFKTGEVEKLDEKKMDLMLGADAEEVL